MTLRNLNCGSSTIQPSPESNIIPATMKHSPYKLSSSPCKTWPQCKLSSPCKKRLLNGGLPLSDSLSSKSGSPYMPRPHSLDVSTTLARSRRFSRKFFNLNMFRQHRHRGCVGEQSGAFRGWQEGGWTLQTNPLADDLSDLDDDLAQSTTLDHSKYHLDDFINGESIFYFSQFLSGV